MKFPTTRRRWCGNCGVWKDAPIPYSPRPSSGQVIRQIDNGDFADVGAGQMLVLLNDACG
ncbi:hypothetical protein PILCRDRAFT_827391 [Piloderma croceum F 1598]|uniref:Uncharacterized protein n=1 Tax=Piloderma croceum (strain F 1598) TaxID=765440 RepID=A0A0C3F5X7_PILCF|nr:hypothetical protein PILCRDRAFT_827391 [Piloderma croceum F 1598]